MKHTLSCSAIEINGLSKKYRIRGDSKWLTAVEHIDLSVPRGQVFGFLGPNGAGKTTTIKMICGLITPDTGQIHLNGYDVLRQRKEAMRQIGAVLEGTRNIYWRLSALENVMYFGRLKNFTGPKLKAEAERLLSELQLWERRNDRIRTFSRGMQQKVAIACALIADPPIVLLDEPTLGLDIQAAVTVKEWVRKLAREQGRTVILTTHQLDMAEELCDRVAIIRKGKLVADQPLSTLLSLHRACYQIRIKGCVAPQRMALPHGFSCEHEDDETLLTGAIDDQKELYTLLNQLRSLDLPLLAVTPVEPNLEEVFINMISEEKQEILC
ncbi:MAG TPA: ABC transporter ATP-binding protein [Ktedonosporobacter sp.]|jgi:ABC-2 type transport system ATP-binding protein|nr:ABC transporter ATP-binding protein [Ktedonosporobacter sp.]